MEKKVVIIWLTIVASLVITGIFIVGCKAHTPAEPGVQNKSEMIIPDRILNNDDIKAELEKLERINRPGDKKIDREDYPNALGRYSENELVLVESYFCSDVCPDYGRIQILYYNVSDKWQCAEAGGMDVTDPAWGGYIGCTPRLGPVAEMSSCENKHPSEKDMCFFNVASDQNNISICYLIQGQREKDWCIARVAGIKGNVSACKEIMDEHNKDSCFSDAAQANKDSDICDLINDSRAKDWCCVSIGRKNLDISACDKIQTESTRHDCFVYIAQSTMNLSVCEEYLEGSCYSEMAYMTRNLSMCNLEQDQRAKYFCYNSIASITGNVTICDNFDNRSWADLCYFNVANNKKDVSICNKIIGENLKVSCYEEAKKPKGFI